MSPDGLLPENIERTDHPWFVATQFHPEFLSRPNRPHPLFRDFIAAALHTFREGDQRPLPLEEMLTKNGNGNGVLHTVAAK